MDEIESAAPTQGGHAYQAHLPLASETTHVAHSTVLSTTGPVGEPGLPPSRPTSISSPPSRAGNRVSGGVARRNGGRDSHSNDTSRRTHVPNLTPEAFLRPMTSRHLREQQQAQQKMATQHDDPLPTRISTESERKEGRHRTSNASIRTNEPGRSPLVDADAPPVPTIRPTATTVTDSVGGSPALTNRQIESSSVAQQPSGRKSAMSLASFGLPARNSVTNGFANGLSSTRLSGHEKLESGPPSPQLAPAKNGATQSSQELGRNYEYYNGNAVFLCNGRLLNARQRPLNLWTLFLAALPGGLFFGFSAPWLWHHVSPAIPIVFAYVFFICISAYLHASFSDPGVCEALLPSASGSSAADSAQILPRNLHPHPSTPSESDPLALGPATTEWVTVRSFAPSASGAPNTAMEVPVKYCKSCNIWRPPRAHHCRVCDACIETQDHHCVWLNNCVGRRNYRHFFTFVASGTLMCLFLLAASLAHILVWRERNHTSFGAAINHWRVPFAMFIYSILIIPYPGSLFIYHMFLMARGETTREYLNSHKFMKKDRHRPFSQGSAFRNWVAVLCRPRPPTYMRFKARFAEGDRRLGEQSKVKGRGDDVQDNKDDMEMKEMLGVDDRKRFQGPGGRAANRNTPRPA